jgi:hypothetical protein
MATIHPPVPAEPTTQRHARDPITETLTVMASVMVATILIVENVWHFGFDHDPGWIAILIAVVAGGIVTFLAVGQRPPSPRTLS